MTKLEFLDKINGILIGLNTAESDALGSLYDELMRPQWIPVEEELPKETGWYLVATPTLNSKIDVALWDGKWRRFITITHWMPMPEVPRKEANNDV